ncbi:MAG: type II secretion system F family protein [Candidatus Aceula meridiana]|nr:type II secretion system F family protein [Candidatus Aceula meridiana]
MLVMILILAFFSVFTFVLGVASAIQLEGRPTLDRIIGRTTQKKQRFGIFRHLIRALMFFNKPLCAGPIGERMRKDLNLSRVGLFPEEFIFVKESAVILLLFITYPYSDPNNRMFWLIAMIAAGWYLPEFWIKTKIKKIKNQVIKDLPDAIDLLSLCVNAGLDFLLALKWVIDKSVPSILILELNHVLQEVQVGKPRRDALVDFANKYQIPDLSTFTRALVQADRMGTSVSDALNIISEDMRVSRFRRGEQTALKAPLKMLFPLLFCIFPVVGILVAGPILLQFMQENPLKALS